MNEELSVGEIRNQKLVGSLRSLFENAKGNSKLQNSKTHSDSQEKELNENEQVLEINKKSNTGKVNYVDEESNIDVRNQIIMMNEKVSKMGKEILQENKKMSRKINEMHQFTTSVDEVLSQISEKLNRLRMDNKTIVQTLFDHAKEESLDNVQKTESEGASESNKNEEVVDSSYVRDALEKIVEITADVEKLRERAKLFSGTKDDLNYLDIGFKLLENIMKVDVIQAHGIEEIRIKKKELVEFTDISKKILDSNLIPT